MDNASAWSMWMTFILIILLIVGIIRAISKGLTKSPTWKGAIISFLIGLLPFYLLFCLLGWMGEVRNRY